MPPSVYTTPKPVLPTSSIGGFMFYGGGTNPDYRLFCQLNDGGIYAWIGDSPYQTIIPPGTARTGTPIRSVFYTAAGGSGSRTFYLNSNNEVCVFSVGLGGDGPLKDPNGNTFKARPDSGLAAFAWVLNNQSHVRVAYQLAGGEVQQINHDGTGDSMTFQYAHKSPPTDLGTSFSFINQSPKGSDQYFRGYYQHSGTIMELVNEPSAGWIGSFYESVPNKTQIIASYPAQTSSGQQFPRGQGWVGVYWVNTDGTMSKRVFQNGSWGSKQNLPSNIQLSPGSSPMVFTYTPPNALSPVRERILWVGNDHQLHCQEL